MVLPHQAGWFFVIEGREMRNKKLQMDRRRIGLIGIFADMLASFGASFVPVKSEPKTKEQKGRAMHRAAQKEDRKPRRRGIGDGYVWERWGQLRRNKPKRDRSISARQWKKRTKAARRVAALPEGLQG